VKAKRFRLGLVIESASEPVAGLIRDKISRVFPGVVFDLLTSATDSHSAVRNVFRVTGRWETLRLLLRVRKRYDLLIVSASGDRCLRFARAAAVLLMGYRAPVFVFNEFAEGFWLDRKHWTDLRSHLAMRYAGPKASLLSRLRLKHLLGLCIALVLVPLVVVLNLIRSILRSLVGAFRKFWKMIRPAQGARLESAVEGSHQSMENQTGEISYRRGASFGEPDKVMEGVREGNAARRKIFERLHTSGQLQGPFLEIGAGVGQTALLLNNEFGLEGAATDISLHSLAAGEEVAKRLGYEELPLRICCDARWLPFEDDTFRFTYCFQTLHHFADPGPIMQELRRVLSPGGHFYFAEEPVRRWLCLDLYRCERPENLQGFDRWLYETGLLRYVAEAYVGSKEESVWGIMENQTISLAYWRRCFAGFDEVDLDTSKLFTRDAIVFRGLLRRLGVPVKKADYAAAFLFGSELSGLCRLKASGQPQIEVKDLRDHCRCPDCHGPLRWTNGSSAYFECEQCGPFPQKNGVHLLFRRVQLDALYRTPADPLVAPTDDNAPGHGSHGGRVLVDGAQIIEARLLDGQGDPTLRVRSGEDTVIQVSIECSQPLANPVIGLIIHRQAGDQWTVIYDTNTIWREQDTGDFSPGKLIDARFAQKMNLGPGAYSVTVAIASHDASAFYDWRDRILVFEVEACPQMRGIFNLDSGIEISTQE